MQHGKHPMPYILYTAYPEIEIVPVRKLPGRQDVCGRAVRLRGGSLYFKNVRLGFKGDVTGTYTHTPPISGQVSISL